MTLSNFFELVEIKAKTASILPFAMGVCYSWYHYKELHLVYTCIFFIAMVMFNMAVDALDNYNDYKKATDIHDYKHKTNIIGRENLSPNGVLVLITCLVIISASLGIWMVTKVGLPLLWLGLYSYAIGFFYSSGPKPLSSLPVGEFFSGITMGFIIVLICVYINTYDVFQWTLHSVGSVLLISLPNVCLIANLMLANNTCDIEEDEKNNRYTLVHYLGKQNSVKLFVLLNIAAAFFLILSVFTGDNPKSMILVFLITPLVVRQVKLFLSKQVKSETFQCAVKILAMGSFAQLIAYVFYFLVS